MNADSRRSPVEPGQTFPGQPNQSFEVERGELETYVPDGRSLLRPAQVVESRVFEVLQQAPVLVSQFERPARPRYR